MAQYHYALLATLLLTGQVAYAQEHDDSLTVSKPGPARELLPIEIRALRAGANAPFVKTDLDRKAIEEQNLGQDLPMLLQQTPSAVVTSDAGAGVGYTGLRVRGSDGTRINVTLNGIPVNDAESQGTFFVNTPDLASSASSIQLQRGVGTSTNGAGAFGATLSISTTQQMDSAGVEANISAGSFNTQKYTLKAGTGLLSNGWQFDVRLSRISSDGYIQRSSSNLKALQFLAGWQISDRTRFRFHLLTGAEKTGQAWNGVSQDSLATNRRFNELGLKSDGTYYNDQTDNYQQTYYQAFLDHSFNSRWSGHVGLFLTRGKGYYQEYRLKDDFSDYGLPAFSLPGDTLTETDLIRQLWLDNYYYGGVYSLEYTQGNTQITFGGAATQYTGLHYGYVKWAEYGIPDDHRWYRNDAQKNDFNNYLKAQHRLGKLTLFADMQLRMVSYFMNGFRKNPDLRPDADYTFFNPKAGLNYMLKDNRNDKQRVYASIALSGKEPNRNDFEAGAGTAPKAEQLADLEAGYEISRREWSASANLFYMNYTNQLVLNGQVNDVGAYTRINVDQSYRAGIELQASGRLRPWLSLSGNATYSDNKVKAFKEYIDDWDNGGQKEIRHSNTDIAFSPALIAAFDLKLLPFSHFRFDHSRQLEIDLLGKHVGRQYLDNTSNKARSIADYSLLDLRIRYVMPLKPFRELSVTLAVNNLLDRVYESNGYNYTFISSGATIASNYFYPQAGTNFLFGLGMKF